MTEPTPESLSIAHRYASGVAECAREIEQRVAAAVQEEREYCARVADNAAEEDTQPGCGKIAPGWYWVRRVFTNPDLVGKVGEWRANYYDEIDCRWYPGWTERDKFEIGPRIVPPTDASGPGSASNTDAAQESFQCPSCHWHHGHDPAEWFTEEAKLRGFLELVKRERVPFVVNEEVAESSPTPTVAPPGPTAGDVERARSIIDDAANIVGGPEAGMLCKGIAVALAAERASARAELLAQIRDILADGSKEKDAMSPYRTLQRIQDLADKLTEAK